MEREISVVDKKIGDIRVPRWHVPIHPDLLPIAYPGSLGLIPDSKDLAPGVRERLEEEHAAQTLSDEQVLFIEQRQQEYDEAGFFGKVFIKIQDISRISNEVRFADFGDDTVLSRRREYGVPTTTKPYLEDNPIPDYVCEGALDERGAIDWGEVTARLDIAEQASDQDGKISPEKYFELIQSREESIRLEFHDRLGRSTQ